MSTRRRLRVDQKRWGSNTYADIFRQSRFCLLYIITFIQSSFLCNKSPQPTKKKKKSTPHLRRRRKEKKRNADEAYIFNVFVSRFGKKETNSIGRETDVHPHRSSKSKKSNQIKSVQTVGFSSSSSSSSSPPPFFSFARKRARGVGGEVVFWSEKN